MVKQIYAIECQDGYIYVGESDNPDARYLEHKNGTEHASEFCKRHKPIRQLEVFDKTTPYDETNLTKDYMKKFGIDKVRGGPYTQLELDKSTKDVLEREFLSESNKCYNCGNSGHFIKQCPSKVQIKEEITLKKKVQHQDLIDGNTIQKSQKMKKIPKARKILKKMKPKKREKNLMMDLHTIMMEREILKMKQENQNLRMSMKKMNIK
jgi:predicted GIY-YIG superfamily endonuclease